jgi:phospholipase/carboxylesterase
MAVIDPSVVRWSRPDSERAGTPLLVLMHGVGSNEHDLMGLAQGLPPAWTLASLRAPGMWGGGYSWYPLSTPGAPDVAAVDDATSAVLTWIDEVAPQHSRVGLLGFSQGGSMAIQLVRARPESFAFAVNLSGFVVPGVTDDRDERVAEVRPRVFFGHGTADQVIPTAATERTSAWIAAHADGVDRTYPGLPHGVDGTELGDVTAFIGA